MTGFALDPAVHATLRLALALLFAFAAWHKLRDPRGFREALRGYALLPQRTIAPVAALLPVAEIAAGLALLVPGAPIGVWLALLLLVLYSGAVAANLLRGRRIDCGCGGPARRALGGDLLLRNAFLLLAALACSLGPSQRPLVWLDAFTVLAGATTLALLYAAAETAAANALPALRSRP